MISITITPAHIGNGNNGLYRASGHAGEGRELICNAVSAIEECLAANLLNTWNVRCERFAGKGSYELRWHKTDRHGKGLHRANLAAGFAYNGLKALAETYPNDIKVTWNQQFMERRD